MRSSLMETFDELYFLNLHGNLRTRSPSVNGDRDENVFDVQAGVCVSFMVKLPRATGKCTVQYADVLGSRRHKFNILTESSWATCTWRDLEAAAPARFVPRSTSHEAEYRQGFSLRTVFPVQSSGIATARDGLVVNFTLDECRSRLERFRDLDAEQARTEFRLRQDTRDWQVGKARADLKDHHNARHLYQRYRVPPVRLAVHGLHRTKPRDSVHAKNAGDAAPGSREPRSQHGLAVLPPNEPSHRRMAMGWGHGLPCGSGGVVQQDTGGGNRRTDVHRSGHIPLLQGKRGDEDPAALAPNLDGDFIEELETRLGMTFDSQDSGDGKTSFGPEHCLNYIYAVLHSSA